LNNSIVISKRSIANVYFLIFLLCVLLLNFNFEFLPQNIFILLIFISAVIAVVLNRKIDKVIMYLWVFFGVINIFSGMYAQIIYNISFYKSWAVQMFAFPLIMQFVLNCVYILGIKKILQYIKKVFLFQMYIINPIVVILMLSSDFIIHLNTGGNLIVELMHMLNANIGVLYEYGMSRGYLAYFSIGLYLLSYSLLNTKQKKIFAIYLVVFSIMLGAKAPFIGLLVVLFFLNIRKYKLQSFYKITFTYLIVFLIGALFYKYFDIINFAFMADGRYIFPVFIYSDFWSHFFGVGMGNYSIAAFKEVYSFDIDLVSPLYLSSVFANDMENLAKVYGIEFNGNLDILYPIAESDLLFFSVQLGSLFTIILIYFIFAIFVKNLMLFFKHNNIWQHNYFILFIYLLITSILQDYFNSIFSILFFSFLLVFYKLSKISDKGNL